MNDKEIQGHIEQLVAEEHALFEKGTSMTPAERTRMGELQVMLDRYYDLLRQRRAKREFGFVAETPFRVGLQRTIDWFRARHKEHAVK